MKGDYMKVKINNMNWKKLGKILGVSTVLVLSGCNEAEEKETEFSLYGTEEVAEDVSLVYDHLDVEKGSKQVLDVPGEDFKLVVEYSVDLDNQQDWTITAPKKLMTKVYTEGLPEDTNVYIDHVHTDVSTLSNYTVMNGILQDSMDDRIHNSIMYGFPISDVINYCAVNQIEGQNDTFISGTVCGINGYIDGNVDRERFKESDYLEYGVYGSLISSSYGLLVQKGEEEPYGIDVDSTIVVYASNEVRVQDDDKIYTVQYDRNGNIIEVIEETEKTK